jgi:glycosyltransferase involved in cell wall biosynthesis/SAM-dependent methyltransferase
MSNQPLVSAIVIFLNAGTTFFKEAIASIFAQTYENWELLLVDDGSTDESTEIAQFYARTYPEKVRYLEHEEHQNRGMSASRNLGIRHAKGDYIALLDADDIWLPEKLEKQVAILEAQPEAAMVYSSTWMWYSWTGNPEDAKFDRGRTLGVPPDTLVQPPMLLPIFLEGKAETPGTCGILMRRELVDAVGGFEESFRGMYEDQAFFSKVCLQVPIFVQSGYWDRYRQHANSSCFVAQDRGQYNPLGPNAAQMRFLNWLETYLTEQGVKHGEVWQALQHAMFPYRHPFWYGCVQNMRLGLRKGKRLLKSVARQMLPTSFRRQLRGKTVAACPEVGGVKWGSWRRLIPISQSFGFDRGQPIDRYYIENFLSRHSQDIRGRVLEIGDNFYTQKFGEHRVTKSDVLHAVEGNPDATFVGDLTHAEGIPSDTFDCLILTQTLQYLYDVRSAVRSIYRILKPGGVALITLPSITPLSDRDWNSCWYWGFTTVSAQRLFAEVFSEANVQVETYGNVLAAMAFLQGLAVEELSREELDNCDPSYPVSITVRVVKPEVIG